MLENKLGITNETELSKEEEKITKLKALELLIQIKLMNLKLELLKDYLKYMLFYNQITNYYSIIQLLIFLYIT